MASLAPVPDEGALVPPQNLEAEEHVLGAAMLSPTAITACREILSAEGREFYRESHARIWRAALRLADRGEPVDVITITDELEQRGELDAAGGHVRLHELARLVPATANAGHYARIVVEQSQRRDLIRLGSEISRLGWDAPGEAAELIEQARVLTDQLDNVSSGTPPFEVETWAQFERSATEQMPMLVDGLWPEAGLGFIAAPPKKGKTWLALSLGLSVATGRQFLGSFHVETPAPVVYLALEGHRAAIRGRIGALAHGLDLQPQGGHDLDNFHVAYKPAGINLADPAWIRTVRDLVERVGARLLIVDVLRAAAVIKENSNDEFRDLIRTLQPIQAAGCAIAMLHHFGKLTEFSKERTPGERMAGAGAMYGAFDVGVFITKSDDNARTLRVEFETRDVVAPDPLGLHLDGEATGPKGGFVFADAAAWAILDEIPDAEKVKAPASEIAAYVIEHGGEVERREIEGYFEISADTLTNRLYALSRDHRIELVIGRGRGTKSRLVFTPPDADDGQLEMSPESHDPDSYESSLSGGRDFTAAKTLDSALVTESHESHDSDDPQETKTPDLQGEKSHESYDSPTERQAPADAEPATPEAQPPADDEIDWNTP